jgi:hypothetical protein
VPAQRASAAPRPSRPWPASGLPRASQADELPYPSLSWPSSASNRRSRTACATVNLARMPPGRSAPARTPRPAAPPRPRSGSPGTRSHRAAPPRRCRAPDRFRCTLLYHRHPIWREPML